MAADQILTGSESYPAAGSGIGAVVLNDDEGQKNLDGAIANTNNLLAQQRKAQAAALANSQVIMKGLNLKPDGARPQDITTTLQPQAEQIQKNAETINGAFNGNLTSPQARLLWQKNVVEPQQKFESDLARSKGIAKIQQDANAEILRNPNNYNREVYNQSTAHIAALHLDDPALANVSVADLLQAPVPDLDQAMDSYLKQTNPKPVTTESTVTHPDDPGALYNRTTTENVTSPQIAKFANGYRNMPAINAAVQSEWGKMKTNYPDVIPSMMKKYTDQGLSPTQAEDLAQRDWVQGKMDGQHHDVSYKDQFSHYSADTKMKIAAAGAYNKAAADDEKNVRYDYAESVARLFNAVPGSDASFVGNVKLNPYSQATFDDDGKIVLDSNLQPKNPVTKQNTIESIKQNPDGSIDMTTTRSNDAASDANYRFALNPAGSLNPAWKPPAQHFANAKDFYEYVENNKENGDANNVGKAFRKLNAVGADGNINTKVYDLNYSRKVNGQPILSYDEAVGKINGAKAATGDVATKAKQILQSAGKKSDDAAVQLFLKNNPNFK